MSLPRPSSGSALLKTLVLGACLCGTGTRLVVPAQKQPAAQPTAANVSTPPDTAQAIKLYNEQKYDAAIKLLREAVKRRKDDAQAWLHLGIALSRAGGSSKDARKAFERVSKLSPNMPQSYVGMAYLLLDEDKLEAAETQATRAVAVDATNAEAHYALGVITLRRNAPARALAEAETALRLNPNFAGAFVLKAEATLEVYFAAYVERVNRYRMLNRPVEPLSAGERSAMGGMMKEAAESLEKYLKLSPDTSGAAQLREQAETLRLHADHVMRSDEPPVYVAADVTTRAQIVSKPEPLYTEQARHKGITGTIILRMLLSFDGRVRHIVVVKGLGGGLTEMAVNAARRIKFTPATKNGRPVSQFVTIEYNFNIY